MDSAGLNCPKCNYDLTGLPSNVCPECGTASDVETLRVNSRRVGTPVYQCQGIARVWGTAKTLLLMLFRPRAFARRMRMDEPIGPAIAVFLLALGANACGLLGIPWSTTPLFIRLRGLWLEVMTLFVAIGGLVLLFAGMLAIASSGYDSSSVTLRRRFRFWLIVTMYSTVFIAFWPYFGADIRRLTCDRYTTIWPFFYLYHNNHAYVVTLLLLWPTLILSTVLWYRHRPRWVAIILMPVAFLFVRASVQVADMCIMRFAR